jgi:hypothetical protein
MDRPLVSGGVWYLSGIVLGEAWRYFPFSVIGFILVGGVVFFT